MNHMTLKFVLSKIILSLAILSGLPTEAKTQANFAADASNQLGFNLFKALSKTTGNLFLSPISIETTLAMAASGAQGETLKQMLTALHLNSAFNFDFKVLMGQLKGSNDFQLLIANRLWSQLGTAYYSDFLKRLNENYGADLSPIDFRNRPELSRKKINKWVEYQTRDKIKDLLKPGMITRETNLVLINAIYFKGRWALPFKKEMTKNGIFRLSPTEIETTSFMHRTDHFLYSENTESQYLQLPYKGNELVMDVLLPKEGVPLSQIEQKIDSQIFTNLIKEATQNIVDVSLPKFKTDSEFDLAKILSNLGMALPFDKAKANFQGMRKLKSGENIFISKVIHRAFVDVNEEGTEAGAATATLAEGGSAPKEPKIFKADRPFLFFIRHLSSGTILFMGRQSQI